MRHRRSYFVYILTNRSHTVLYTGMTNDLPRRMDEHRARLKPGFTRRYNVDRLVWYEVYDAPRSAIAREKQIKAGSRKRKVALITGHNPEWRDLWPEL